MNSLLFYLQLFWAAITKPVKKTYKANVCSHETNKSGRISSLGRISLMKMPLSENGNPDYCLECIGKMAIECAWCKEPISIGDPVTLYIANEENASELSEHAVRYAEDPQCVVGCLRWNCGQSGIDRQGFWMPPGQVERIPSPLEMMMTPGNEGKAVIIGDLSDPNDKGKLIPID
jgi:hypothetical protein